MSAGAGSVPESNRGHGGAKPAAVRSLVARPFRSDGSRVIDPQPDRRLTGPKGRPKPTTQERTGP